VLEELSIRDVGVIESVTLTLAPGLTVLTGETGAGKTMVVSALELLLGGRADVDSVRSGARRALVEGRLHPAPASAAEWLEDGDEDLVVSREVLRGEGGSRSHARIGGRMAPASALADTVGAVVELHGQSDNARLASAAVQRELLDRSGGAPLAAALAKYRTVHAAWRDAVEELQRLRTSSRDRTLEVERLNRELSEIDAVAPVAGEEQLLDAELRRLEHAEGLIAAAAGAAAAIVGEAGARDALGSSVAALRTIAGIDEAGDELLARVEGLAAETQEVALDLTAYADALELDPQRLEALRQRRAGLARLTRAYGEDAAAVAAYAEQARAELEGLQGGEERIAALERDAAALRADVAERGAALAGLRRAAGKRLARTVEAHLAELAMADARMVVAVDDAEPTAEGTDAVTFLLAANRGEPALPLGKAASGGERSRVALALRLAFADADDTPVLVFDEVDAGIGGSTALAVGHKLARLARGRQVLCVTHLAQLAAFADDHLVVTKRAEGGRTVAGVRRLDDADRLVELSRMLSGTPDSEVAAGHAAELRALATSAFQDRGC